MRADAARRKRAASTWSLTRTSRTWSMATTVPPRSRWPSPTWIVTLRPRALGSSARQWKGMSASRKGGLGGGTVSRRRVGPSPGCGGSGGWARLRPMARSAIDSAGAGAGAGGSGAIGSGSAGGGGRVAVRVLARAPSDGRADAAIDERADPVGAVRRASGRSGGASTGAVSARCAPLGRRGGAGRAGRSGGRGRLGGRPSSTGARPSTRGVGAGGSAAGLSSSRGPPGVVTIRLSAHGG
jgi:hypothetical protein